LVQDRSSLLGWQAFLEGATAPVCSHVATVRLEPRALGLASSCLNHPSWDGVRFTPSLSRGERPLRQFALLWRRRFKSLGAFELVRKGLCLCKRGLSYRSGHRASYAC
jgi:hypothetical protein